MRLVAIVTLALTVAACSPQPAETPASSAAESAAVSLASHLAVSAPAVASDYAGKWQGVEGTSLEITPQGDAYRIIVTNLDGPREFTGTAADGGIQFMRDGATLVIRKGSGEETGMKWLAGKTNCVVVAANEGYCRD